MEALPLILALLAGGALALAGVLAGHHITRRPEPPPEPATVYSRPEPWGPGPDAVGDLTAEELQELAHPGEDLPEY